MDNTLGSFFKDAAKINYLSISKPTRMAGDFVSNWQYGANDDNYYRGISCWGVKKPYISASKSALALNDGNGHMFSMGATALLPSTVTNSGGYYSTSGHKLWSWDKPTGGSASPYRLGDFRGYTPSTYYYGYKCQRNPFRVTVSEPIISGENAFSLSAQLVYSMADALPNTSRTLEGSLGMEKLFNISDSYPAFLGIIVYAPVKNQYAAISTDRTAPLCLIVKGEQLGKKSNMTGYDDQLVANMPLGTWMSAAGDATHFKRGEKVFVMPVIIKYDANNWYFIGLNHLSNNGMYLVNLGTASVSTGSRGTISSISIKVTMVKADDGSGEYRIYIANSTDLTITCSSTGSYLSTSSLSLSAGDGNTTTVKVTDGDMSGSWDDELESGTVKVSIPSGRKLYASNISGWSSNTAPRDRKVSCVLKPGTGVTSFKVVFHMGYWYKSWTYFNKTATINTSDTSGTTYTLT